MVLDVGTGDGRAVVARARAEPAALVVGIDADARSMAESSRRAARRADRGGAPNALFLVAAAEALPGPLAGAASLVTVTFPWGSLLAGVVGHAPAVTAGIAGLVACGGRIEILASIEPGDGVAGIERLGDRDRDRIAAAWSAARAGAGVRCAARRPKRSARPARAGAGD